MIDRKNHTDENPPNWDRYAELLRGQPRPAISKDRLSEMMPRIDAAIESHAHRSRVLRWVVMPTLSAAAVIVLLMFEFTAPEPAPRVVKRSAPAIVQNSGNRQRPARRVIRKRLPPPSVSFDFDEDANLVEVAPPVREGFDLPQEDPATPGPGPGPGHSRKPHAGGR